MWPANLSVRLPIVDLVGRYLTNYLIGRELTPDRIPPLTPSPCGVVVSCGISTCFQVLSPCPGQIAHALLTRPPLEYSLPPRRTSSSIPVRLACVKHAASVRPEPGSNSDVQSFSVPSALPAGSPKPSAQSDFSAFHSSNLTVLRAPLPRSSPPGASSQFRFAHAKSLSRLSLLCIVFKVRTARSRAAFRGPLADSLISISNHLPVVKQLFQVFLNFFLPKTPFLQDACISC